MGIVARSSDDGMSWDAGATGGYYGYLGRSTDGQTYTEVDPQLPEWSGVQWYNGIAAQAGGLWWAVGEAGTILHSSDDGETWTVQTNPSSEDLYAVSFTDPSHGLAVGVHGAAVYTENGGAAWQDVSTGLDLFLADLIWISTTQALVIGERGALLTFTEP